METDDLPRTQSSGDDRTEDLASRYVRHCSVKTIRSEKASATFDRQIAASDVILLNKCDVAQSSDLQDLERNISILNPTASVYRTTQGELPVAKILNLSAYSKAPSVSTTAQDHHHTYAHDDHGDHDHEHNHQHEGNPATSFGLVSSIVAPLPTLTVSQAEKLDEWLRTLIWEQQLATLASNKEFLSSSPQKIEVWRCKGVYRTTEGKEFIIQGVRDLYDTKQLPFSNQPTDTRSTTGKIVLIGWLGDQESRKVIQNSLTSFLSL